MYPPKYRSCIFLLLIVLLVLTGNHKADRSGFSFKIYLVYYRLCILPNLVYSYLVLFNEMIDRQSQTLFETLILFGGEGKP